MTSKGRKIYKIFSTLAVIAIMVTIFALSAQEARESNETSGMVIDIFSLIFGKEIPQEILRTAAHFCEYAGLGFFMCNMLYSYKERLSPIISAILSWAYAWTDEIHQIFVDGRAFQLSDLLVDLGGVAAGTLAFALLIVAINYFSERRKAVER